MAKSNPTLSSQRWEAIRSNWVNGNRQDARDQLYQLNKLGMLKVIEAAILDYCVSCDPHTHNGALDDLVEIIRSYGRA